MARVIRPSKTCEVQSWMASSEPDSCKKDSQLGQPDERNCCARRTWSDWGALGWCDVVFMIQSTWEGHTAWVRTMEQTMHARR